MSFFRNIELSGFWFNAQNQWLLPSILLYTWYVSDWDHGISGIWTSSSRESYVWKSSKISINRTFGTFKTLMQGPQIDNPAIEKLCETIRFWIPNLLPEKEPAFLGKQEFEFREKMKMKGVLWKFRTIRCLTQGKKSRMFRFDTRLPLLSLYLRSWWNCNSWWLINKSLSVEGNQFK